MRVMRQREGIGHARGAGLSLLLVSLGYADSPVPTTP